MKDFFAQKTYRLYFFEIVVLSAFFIFAFFITFTLLKTRDIFVSKNENQTVNTTYSQKPFVESDSDDKTVSVLLLGYGGAGHDGGTLSDVLMLAHINYESKNVSLISIPRDLWVSIPVRSDLDEYYKINMAHAIGLDDNRFGFKEPQYKGAAGGGTLAKDVVQTVTGISPDYFVSVSFDGFKDTVDTLGGLDVTVPVSFEDHFYPIKGLENETCGFTAAEIDLFHRMYSGFELEKQFTCRYEVLKFNAGLMRMDGATALKFVRSRHSDTHGGDFARSQRQQAILEALKEKTISLNIFNNYTQFVDSLSKTITTDFDLASLDSLIDLLGSPEEYTFTNINLSTDNVLTNSTSSQGAYILVPKAGIGNWSEVHKYIGSNIK